MSEGFDTDENFCFFGKPLDPYDEDAFPKNKPISVEDQIATDAQGRRRFHGAFTGGFSAGFYNTVGSLEGWTPAEFISSRCDKAVNIVQKPQDFMDDEDLGVYGIAPQTVRATSEYSTSKKRRRPISSDGPIPGEPVLEALLKRGNETVGYMLLKNIGIQDKINKRDEELSSSTGKIYGCQVPTTYKISESIERKQYVLDDIYKDYLTNPKSNSFGLGYQGLCKTHNLFRTTNLVVHDKNKKLSIGGQAFGVGAFEEDDEDIYKKEDISNYDFELTKEIKNKQKSFESNLLFDMFSQSKIPLINKRLFPLPNIPHSFTGKHKVRKSRFEPVETKTEQIKKNKINPAVRAKCLGEIGNESITKSKPIIGTLNVFEDESSTEKKQFEVSSLLISDRFVAASQKEDVNNIIEFDEKKETTHGTMEMREAARMKMFGPLTRITEDWHPCTMLCKRFNVQEPLIDQPEKKWKRTQKKNLIFENQKYSVDEVLLKAGVTRDEDLLDKKNPEVKDTEGVVSSDIPVTVIPSIQESNEVLATEDIKYENDKTPVIDITDKIGLAEKTDLFKAVFLSSSESDDEEDEKQVEKGDSTEELKSVVLSETLIPKLKPLKPGILSHVNSQLFTKPEREGVIEHMKPITNVTECRVDMSLYGPALPIQKLEAPFTVTMSNSSDDEWVEKEKADTASKNRHKKKKEKHKKHKHARKSKG